MPRGSAAAVNRRSPAYARARARIELTLARPGGGAGWLAAAARHPVGQHRRIRRRWAAAGRAHAGGRRRPLARALARGLSPCLPLHGVGVLVTRPELQAMPLCRLLETQGASTLRLPAIEIKAFGDRRALAARSGRAREFRCHHFHQRQCRALRRVVARSKTRSDARRHRAGDGARPEPSGLPRGRATAVEHLRTPRVCFCIRGLEHLAGHRILIIKGSNGRQLLEQELTRRGAQVVCGRCLRTRAGNSERGGARGGARAIRRRSEMQVITATSLEIGAALARAGAA